MRPSMGALLALLFLFQPVVGAAWSGSPSSLLLEDEAQPGLFVSSAINGLVLEWTAPLAHISHNDEGLTRVRIDGFLSLRSPGSPVLPYTTALIAILPGSHPGLVVLEKKTHPMAITAPFEIAPEPQGTLRSAQGEVLGGAFSPAIRSLPVPDQPVTLERLGSARGVELWQATFYPIHLSDGQLVSTSLLRVLVDPGQGVMSLPDPDFFDPFLSVLQSQVVNPQELYTPVLQQSEISAESAVSQDTPTAMIEISQTGLTQVTYAALYSTGFLAKPVDPHFIQLHQGDQEVAYEWDGDDDNLFEPGERLLFIAQPRFSRWTNSDVYRLTLSETGGIRIGSLSTNPTGLPEGIPWLSASFEEQIFYTPDCYCGPISPGRNGERWAWQRLDKIDQSQVSQTFVLNHVDISKPAHLRLWLTGYTDLEASPDHRVSVAINNQLVGAVEWDGKTTSLTELDIPIALLLEGMNNLSLSLPGLPDVSVEGAWLDAFEVRYATADQSLGTTGIFTGEEIPHAYNLPLDPQQGLRVYDITDPVGPIRLEGFEVAQDGGVRLGDASPLGPRRYWLGGEMAILDPDLVRLAHPLSTNGINGGDFLILTPSEFRPALASLIALRQQQGLNIVVEELGAVYDHYAGGIPEPEAIRDFIKDAYHTWDHPPLYVLLVGDGSSDPKGYQPGSSLGVLPPYLAVVDPWAGETAADNLYAAVDGEDHIPDLFIGRLPVNSIEETQTVVSKIVAYETQENPGSWANRLLAIADNPDGGGDFPVHSDQTLVDWMTSSSLIQKVYYTPNDLSEAEMRLATESALNHGSELILYTGHASVHQWAAENFFHLDDVQSLSNGIRLPVVLELTCFSGAFQVPAFPTLDESLLRHPTGGAVAIWGPTGLGVATGHTILAQGFLSHLQTAELATIGSAAFAGKLALAAQLGAEHDLLNTYHLLGDPATRLVEGEAGNFLFLPFIDQK